VFRPYTRRRLDDSFSVDPRARHRRGASQCAGRLLGRRRSRSAGAEKSDFCRFRGQTRMTLLSIASAVDAHRHRQCAVVEHPARPRDPGALAQVAWRLDSAIPIPGKPTSLSHRRPDRPDPGAVDLIWVLLSATPLPRPLAWAPPASSAEGLQLRRGIAGRHIPFAGRTSSTRCWTANQRNSAARRLARSPRPARRANRAFRRC